MMQEAIVLQNKIVHSRRSAFRQVAPATDEAFVSRVALRRLCTQVVSDHFFGVVVATASAVNPKTLVGGRPPARAISIESLVSQLRMANFTFRNSQLSRYRLFHSAIGRCRLTNGKPYLSPDQSVDR
jgi:hypothetical protein